MRRLFIGLAFASALALGACTGAGGSTQQAASASATVQRSAITVCTAYADALQVAAVLRRARQLSTSTVATVDRIRAQMTPACSNPITEAGLVAVTDGLAALMAALKGGA